MSKKYLQTLETTVRNDIKTMDAEEVYYEYSIIFHENGKVFDDVNNRLYSSLDEWLDHYLDDSEEDIDFLSSHKGYFDD
jgi:type I restriction-modification system DNA methylase subunit